MITEQAFKTYERALMSQRPLTELRAVVQGMLKAGRNREDLLAELEQLALELRRQHREADEDVVLDVTDFVTGWSAPHMKV